MSTSPPSGPVGAGAPLQDEHDALPAGTRLGEFEVLKVLGIGGFGIVYLAMDHALERLVAVKEYMPSMMAARGRGTQVSLRSSLHQDTFTIGLRSFVNEAKLLARFNHPSLVKVYRFWEDNGTAYMAMPYYAGRTLKDERRAMTEVPNEAWLRALVDPLLGAMEVLHREDVYHRDIAPDNILLLPDGPPVLLDFGAARSVIGDRTQSLTAVLKPSYAPIEQYADVGHLRQGAWTDLYALGAVLHFVVMGRPPTPSASRAVHDEQPLLTSLGAERTGSMPAKILKAIDWALTVSPHTRPQSVQQFRDALDGRLVPPERTAHDAAALRQEPSRAAPSGWAQTLQVKGEEGDAAFSGGPAAFADTAESKKTVVAPPRADAGGHGASAAGPRMTDDTTVVMGNAARGPEVAPASAAPAPAAVDPTPEAHARAGSNAAPAAAPGAPGAAADGAAQRPRSSRALPPLFAVEEPPATGHSSAARTAVALGVVAVLALGIGGWLLKDRFMAPSMAGANAVAVPASAAFFPPPAASAASPLPPVEDAVPVPQAAAAASVPSVSVPDWSGQAKPLGSASAASSSDAASLPVVPGKEDPGVRHVPPAARVPAAPPRQAATRTPPPPAAAAASTPSELCTARGSGTMANCMRRVCTQGALYEHPQCVEQRRNDQW
jgi:hypothetical protein